MTRLMQIDLIDMRTRPDVISIAVVYRWILHCIDHFSKFTRSFPLENKSAGEVASKLRQLFFTFGPPHLLHSDNGAEFVAQVIFELKSLFPDMCFIRGRPRHPQSQGCIERANGVLSIALGKWLDTNNSVHWSDGLLPVAYGINTRVSSATKTTPYEIMFGQRPRSDSDFWKIVKECDIMDEEQLPTPIERADVVVDEIVEQSTINETVIDDFDKQKENDNLNIDNFIPEMFPLLNTNNGPNAAGVLYYSFLDLSPSSSYDPYHQPLGATINLTTEN
ncbi:unnamed protein product, partial [Didymodactylos carnosus]